MKKIFTADNFIDQLEELKTVPFEIKMLRGAMNLNQTQRNQMRRELIESFVNFLKEIFEPKGINVYNTPDGIAFEVENQSVLDEKVGNGFITFLWNLTVTSLEYDAYEASLIA